MQATECSLDGTPGVEHVMWLGLDIKMTTSNSSSARISEGHH